jgi:hypothetical protein
MQETASMIVPSVGEIVRLRNELNTACSLLAQMHAAAVGEIQGPDVDPVTDILNLRKDRDQWRECADKLVKRLQYWMHRDSDYTNEDEELVAEFDRLKEASK